MAISICNYCDCAGVAARRSAGSSYCAACQIHVRRISDLRQREVGFLRIVEIDRCYLRQRRAGGIYVPAVPRAAGGSRR